MVSVPPEGDWRQIWVSELEQAVEGFTGDKARAREDLAFYSEYVIGHSNPEYTTNSEFLKRLYHELQYAGVSERRPWGENLLVLGPRGSAKSSAATITYSTFIIGHHPSVRILVACASMEAQGYAFMRQIDSILTTNERYIELFGNLKPEKPEKWDRSEKIVKRPDVSSGIKDATISTVGLGSAVPSKRADIVICDDLVTMDNSKTQMLREATVAFVFTTLFPILTPRGRRIVIGSRWHEHDLYNYLATKWGLKFPKLPAVDMVKYIREYWEVIGLSYEQVEALIAGSEASEEFEADAFELPSADEYDPDDFASIVRAIEAAMLKSKAGANGEAGI